MQHPGLLLNKLRKAANLTKRELAIRCELNRITLSHICNGKMAITLRIARMLEREGFGTEKQWLKLQNSYELFRETSPE